MLSHWHIRSVLALLLSLSFAALAEDRSNRSALPTYRSTVSEVQVTFFATDQNNHSVLTITQSDLAAIDNERVIRNFRSFTRTDETALDVVVAVDLSESVLSRLAETKSELLQLLAQERAVPNEKISVLSFGGSFGAAPGRVLQESSGETEPAFFYSLDCGTAHSLNKLSAINSGSATPLFDALISAASFISSHRRAGARPILILISDGNDTISLHSAPDALAATLEAGALVYSIDIGSSEQHTLHRSGSAFLRQISESTGGRYFTGSDGRSQTTIFRVLNAALDDMRASYVLTYDLPKSESEFHSQRLLPSHNLNLTFHSRSSYNTVDQSPTRDSKNAD
jgi:VWFA-related protein